MGQGEFGIMKKLVALLSTGLDSPIACYLMMRKGYDIISLSMLNGKEKSIINLKKIEQIANKLVELTGRTIYMNYIDYDQYLDNFISNCDPKITCILCKRTMLQMASVLAKKHNALGIINGDILGEQASQTLDNLFVVNEINSEIPVIRPLIGFDKLDIIRLSRHTGLYDISLIEGIGCDKNPQFPETHAKIKYILENEQNIDRIKIIEQMLSSIKSEIIAPIHQ
jgi:thiamine biosynthesis protein ThiI